jgi:hypothetical protein
MIERSCAKHGAINSRSRIMVSFRSAFIRVSLWLKLLVS